MVGTYYSSPSPDSPSFCGIGDIVRKGQTLCILEAMKIMNEVEAEFDCKIIDILVQNGAPVEYDMPIFIVEKSLRVTYGRNKKILIANRGEIVQRAIRTIKEMEKNLLLFIVLVIKMLHI